MAFTSEQTMHLLVSIPSRLFEFN